MNSCRSTSAASPTRRGTWSWRSRSQSLHRRKNPGNKVKRYVLHFQKKMMDLMLGVMYSSLGYYIKFSFLQVPKPAPEESEGSDEVEEPSPPRRKPKPAAPPRKEAKTGHSAFADKLKKSRWPFFFFCNVLVNRSFFRRLYQSKTPFFPTTFSPRPNAHFFPIARIVFGTNFSANQCHFYFLKNYFGCRILREVFFLLENCGIIFYFKEM